jgi:NAD(P)-dependent dehydrogenase (short-subunit alcohol dehydrogenase family)
VLINNAGIAIRRPALDISLQDWDAVVRVNMTGTSLCARAAARHMIETDGGSIVSTASIMGLSGGGFIQISPARQRRAQ